MLSTLVMLTAITAGAVPVEERINLVDFARVVQYTGDSPATLAVRELERGADGWSAWRGDDGQYMIAVEWDEPRDVAEVNIEFRHAIADRDQIRVQYWQHHWPSSAGGGWAPLDDPFHGKWVTGKGDWWAGDRDVSLAFVPYREEQPGDNAPGMRYRRTCRLRFACGQNDLPPVRYLRAYGPSEPAEATFDIRLDPDSNFRPPLMVSVVNGYVLGGDGLTTTQTARLDDAPASIHVRYAEGDLDTATRTIVTVRDRDDPLRGWSFLPAEAVKYGIIRVPALGVVIMHRGSERDLEAGLSPGTSVFDRVGAEPEQTFKRARREIPALKKTRHEGQLPYLPIGPPDARQEIAVSCDGSILLAKSALKARAADHDRLNWPAEAWMIRLSTGEPPFDHASEGNVKQKLLDGYLPIVINSWVHGGIACEQTCVATFLAGEPADMRGDETVVLLSRLKVTNTLTEPAHAVVRLRSDPGEALMLDDRHVLARGAIKDGKIEPYDEPRYRFRVRAPKGGKLAVAPAGDDSPQSMLLYRHRLGPGESAVVTWLVPFVTIDTDAEREQIARLDFNHVLTREADRWRRIVAGAARMEVPDPLLSDFYKAQLTHILITADRDPYNGTRVLPAATYSYHVCLNESCHQIRALEVRGLHDEAQRFLDAFVEGQSSRGLHGRFPDKEGVLHGLPTKHGDYQTFNYNLDHGFALWMLNEHYRFTRDRAWLKRNAHALIAACDFVTRARQARPESNTLGQDDVRWGVGLLPPGHLEDPPEWLWWFAVNAYACRGMRATAESLAEIGHDQTARIARDAEAFGRDLSDSCRESMVRAPVVRLRDGTYVPHQPTRSRLRGRDLGWIRDALYGPVHLIDCGIYLDESAEAEWILRDAEDNVFIGEARGRKLDDFDRQWFSWGGITLQSNLLPNPLVYLRRGQPKHAIRAFYNSLAANVYADVRTFCEHPIQAYGIGTGPFFKSPDESAFIVWLRHLLILERGNDLELLAGVPAAWLTPGKEIAIQAAATWFGPMDLRVRSRAAPRQVVVDLSAPSRNPPHTVRLHLRVPEPIRAVMLDGQALTTFNADKGIITLPGRVGRAGIVVSY